MRRLAAIALTLVLAACSLTPPPDVTTPPPPPQLAPPSPTTTAECNDPVEPRDGPATQKQTEELWGIDVDSLKACKAGKHILIKYVRKRDAGLTGAGAK